MSENLNNRMFIYNALIDTYSELFEKEKEDFDNGLTMIFNNSYFTKFKKSNINYQNPIIIEIWNLALLGIKFNKSLNLYNGLLLLTTLSENKEFNKIRVELMDGKKIDEKVLFSFIRIMRSISTNIIIKEIIDEKQRRNAILKMNFIYETIQSRFNVDFNKLPQEIKTDYKGKPSILMNDKKTLSREILLKNLISLNLIQSKQNIDDFKNIFSGKHIEKHSRVIWSGSNLQLMFFLKCIKSETIFKYLIDLYITATRCFIKEDLSQYELKEILKARGKSENKDNIEAKVKKAFR